MGFTLSIKNAPAGTAYWFGGFDQGMIVSPLLPISQSWKYQLAIPEGINDMQVVFYEADKTTVLAAFTIPGQILDGKSYVWDDAAGTLAESGSKWGVVVGVGLGVLALAALVVSSSRK